jgi:hypothetical protein
MIEWVKFSCDCIGTKPEEGKTESLLIRICDRSEYDEDDIVCLSPRDMADMRGGKPVPKPYEVLDPEDPKVMSALNQIRQLFADGRNFQEIRRMLR